MWPKKLSGLHGVAESGRWNVSLPVKLHGELELAWIVGRCGRSGIGEERTDGGHIHFVGNVEHVCNQLHVEALAEEDAFGYPHIVEDRPGRNSRIAAEIAVELQKSRRGQG